MKNITTDLIVEQEKENLNNILLKKDVDVIKSYKNKHHYTTIFFKDIMDNKIYKKVQNLLIEELNKYLNIEEKDRFLVIGLGNRKSTPDSLGPYVIDNILVTRYLFLFDKIKKGFSNVCSFIPDVMGNTGLETSNVIKSIIKESKANKVIIIDALKTNNLDRLVKTIQITDKGISPGSGVFNNRKKINKSSVGAKVYVIGIPTVLDIRSIVKSINTNFIVTPTDIDFLIERCSYLLANSINIALHKNYNRQNITK